MPISVLGQKLPQRGQSGISALPPKADIAGRQLDVRFVPQPDIAPLVDDLARELLSFGIHSYCLTKPPMLKQQHS
jgi:hypothetical protein